jgi:hypothetical protein
MIVDAFTESLEIGLESPGQVVVSTNQLILSRLVFFGSDRSLLKGLFNAAYDPYFRVRMAKWGRDWRISGTRPWCARSISTPPIGNLTNAQVEPTSACVS